MIRPCADAHVPRIVRIINDAAEAYRDVIPADCWRRPYMNRSELLDELANGVRFAGWEENGRLMGVMGLQDVRDVTLIRHAYVTTAHQGKGIGGELLKHLMGTASRPLLVGTWADATWAIRFYEKHGFRQVDRAETDRLLTSYWTISPRQRETSVVLRRIGAAP